MLRDIIQINTRKINRGRLNVPVESFPFSLGRSGFCRDEWEEEGEGEGWEGLRNEKALHSLTETRDETDRAGIENGWCLFSGLKLFDVHAQQHLLLSVLVLAGIHVISWTLEDKGINEKSRY